MNKVIKELYQRAHTTRHYDGDPSLDGNPPTVYWQDEVSARQFAELIVEEFRNVLADEYRKTPLQCCGHFLRADEAILEHFYGVDSEPTL